MFNPLVSGFICLLDDATSSELEGSLTRDFHESVSPSVNNTAKKLFTGVNDTADKFFGGVSDTGDKRVLPILACLHLK
jgi:hypothetical protein